MTKTVCKNCGKRTSIKRHQDMNKAKCQHCKSQLIIELSISGYFLCGCGTIITPKSKFAWKKISCHSCGEIIKHPALATKGGHPDRGTKYPAMMTIKCTKETKRAIEVLGNKLGSSSGAVTRHLLKIGLDHLQ